jgi:dTDP-4-amino-4,6-dideoxygalactose transaminase
LHLKKPFLVFGAPDIQQAEIDEVVDSMRRGWLGTGPKVTRFERDIAAFKQVDPDRLVALNSCTAALHLSLLAAGVGPGDEVITTALTFCATVNAIIQVGATPVLADVDPITSNIDAQDVERRITPRTRALLPVHFAGRPCDMDALMALAGKHGLKVIEDCAHALEAQADGRGAGTFGDFGCFSFYATKNVTAGEGGMVLARNAADAARIRLMSLHGMSADAWKRFGDTGYRHYQVVEAGFKYNMMDLQAAIGIHQLQRVEAAWQRRQILWRAYQEALASLPVHRPADPAGNTRHSHHLYAIQVESGEAARDKLLQGMTARGIGVGVHYLSVAEHPYYQERFGWTPDEWPHAMRIGRATLSLPLMPQLTSEDQGRVVQALSGCLRGEPA